MSQGSDPRRAIVSIWHGAVLRGKFLGSGAFVSPRLVLTAKHLLETRQSKDICLGLISGTHEVPANALILHKTKDIALIELDRDFGDQDLIRLDCGSSSLEGREVDLYGVNPDSENCDICKGYTLGTWVGQENVYLFDHAQRKGFSGGIVVCQGLAVGVITQRAPDKEQQGVMVPLYSVYDWFKEILSPEILTRYFPSNLPGTLPELRPPQGQNECAQHVRRQLGQWLNRQKLRALRECLTQRAAERHLANAQHLNPVDLLIPQQGPISVESAVNELHAATESCLQGLTDQNSPAVPDIVNGATSLLGWLVLLAVSDAWLQDALAPLESLLKAERISIPVTTEAGTEVVVSRLHTHQARLALGEDGFRVFNPNRLHWAELEIGPVRSDRLTEIQRLIWKTVMKSDVLAFGQGEVEELKETLALRYERGENYYVIIPAQQDGSTVADNATLILNCVQWYIDNPFEPRESGDADGIFFQGA